MTLTDDDEPMNRFAAIVAAAMGRAVHRRAMTYLRSKESSLSPGWIELAEVEYVLIAPNAFDIFDDPDVIAAIVAMRPKKDVAP